MNNTSASEEVDHIVKLYGGWKAEIISQLRTIIAAANPDVTEEVKWRMRTRPEGLPVWSDNGIICILETFKNDQKLVFFKGALLNDSHKVFNARLGSKTDRAIEFHEGDTINKDAVQALVKEATALNKAKTK